MSPPSVRLRGVWKRFGTLGVLSDVSLETSPGQVHALVGENGAGKTTLVRILAGLERADRGSVEVGGRELRPGHSPREASAAGVGLVPQHCEVIPGLSVLENLIVGREPSRAGLVRQAQARAGAAQVAASLGFSFDWNAPAESLGLGQRQRLEIVRLLWRGCSVLVLDEPTTVLTAGEVAGLFDVLRAFAARGNTVILITHKLEEVRQIADRLTVLRAGRVVGSLAHAELDPAEVARLMVGELVPPVEREAAAAGGRVRLRLRRVATGPSVEGGPGLRGVDLEVGAGEIVGVAGIEGNGQSELCEVVLGLRSPAAGSVELDGRRLGRLPVGARRRLGLASIPADRMREGVDPSAPLWENVAAPAIARGGGATWGVVRRRALMRGASRALAAAGVRGHIHQTPRALSGGNIQRLVVARELESDPGVVVAAHPTRGVDVRGAAFVHRRLLDLRRAGSAVLLVSADLDELSRLADRVVVLSEGRVVGGYVPGQADAAQIGLLMGGGGVGSAAGRGATA